MGEYMPFRDVFPSLNKSVAGVSDLAAGSKPCQFEVAGEKVACGICYETIFSDFTRDNQGDASLLINLTIDTWFGTSTAPYFHIMVQSSRAVELGVPMIRSALTGISTVVAADGIPSDYLHLNEEGILTADIGMKDIISPYRAVGPVFRWLMVLISLVLLVWVFRKRRPMKKAEATVSDQAIPPDSDVPAT
jgi:apolipoprotein N-acyltransferase